MLLGRGCVRFIWTPEPLNLLALTKPPEPPGTASCFPRDSGDRTRDAAGLEPVDMSPDSTRRPLIRHPDPMKRTSRTVIVSVAALLALGTAFSLADHGPAGAFRSLAGLTVNPLP